MNSIMFDPLFLSKYGITVINESMILSTTYLNPGNLMTGQIYGYYQEYNNSTMLTMNIPASSMCDLQLLDQSLNTHTFVKNDQFNQLIELQAQTAFELDQMTKFEAIKEAYDTYKTILHLLGDYNGK